MNPIEFQRKWNGVELKERSAVQEHFLDLCRVLDHPTPAEMDPTGDTFTFERGASKSIGGQGWAAALTPNRPDCGQSIHPA